MIKRIIGIDFGTSTTVVKVKQYKDGQPVGDRLAVSYVDFDGNATCPTVIRIGNGHEWYGYSADSNVAKDCVIYRNFKIDLESEDSAIREQAKDLTKKFFKYLNMKYSDQSRAFGDKPDCEITEVSYPAKWSDETREFMINAAKEAGFQNAEGIDEPTAALKTVIVQYADLFEKNKRFVSGGKINVLMIDCGAGTTDLALCRFSVVDEALVNDIIGTWPVSDGNIYFGGREMDKILAGLLKSYLKKYGANENQAGSVDKQINEVKAWKEQTVSPTLGMGPDCAIAECVFIQNLANIISGSNDVPFDPITRAALEKLAHDYIQQYPVLVNGCIDFCHNKMDTDDNNIDYVVLTGGHSQWYFIKDILTGADTAFGSVDLPDIQGHPEKVIRLSRPQETVATGMAYLLMPLKKTRAYQQKKKPEDQTRQDEHSNTYEPELINKNITSLSDWISDLPIGAGRKIGLFATIYDHQTEIRLYYGSSYRKEIETALRTAKIEYKITASGKLNALIINKNDLKNISIPAAGGANIPAAANANVNNGIIISFYKQYADSQNSSFFGLNCLKTHVDECGIQINEEIWFEFLTADSMGNKNALIITESCIYCVKKGVQKYRVPWSVFANSSMKTDYYSFFSLREDVVINTDVDDKKINISIVPYSTNAKGAMEAMKKLQGMLC